MLTTIGIERDQRIDNLRGLLIAIMAINHLNYFAPPISYYTYQPFGFVSAAEGFVFLSGLVAGMVYPKYCIGQNTWNLFERVYRRAGMIYGAHITTFSRDDLRCPHHHVYSDRGHIPVYALLCRALESEAAEFYNAHGG
jgi:hypothetical protein